MTEQPLLNEKLAPETIQAWIDRALREPVAFAELYRLYLDPVYYYLLSRVGDPDEAEDLTAHVFLQALEGLARFKPGSNFPAWLFTIARRRVADFYRKRKEIQLNHDLDIPSTSRDLLLKVIDDEALSELLEEIAHLSEEEQELLRLRFAAGLRFKDIASLLNRKESTVKMTFYRLLARLENQMEKDDE